MSLLHPSPKKGRFDLGETLYQKYLDGKNVDTVLVVGPCRQFHVHRAVLTSASDVFDEVLKGRKGGVQDPNIIRLPDGTTDVAAKAFIQIMYLRKVDLPLTTSLVLEVVSLCDKFIIESLIDEFLSSILHFVTRYTCVEICEGSFDLTKCKLLFEDAWTCLTRNIYIILEGSATKLCERTWEKILLMEGPDVSMDELVLFVHLMRWRGANKSRQEAFQRLVTLIRFPLMRADTIAQSVERFNVLSDKDLADVYTYIHGGGSQGNRVPRFPCYSRKSKVVNSSTQLRAILRSVNPRDFIQLLPGEYETKSSFVIPGGVKIQGSGQSTIIRGISNKAIDVLVVNGHDVEISNLQILCSRKYTHIGRHPSCGLQLWGSRNLVRNVNLTKCELQINGPYSMISNVTCDTGHTGICIVNQGHNTLTDVTLRNLKFGIRIKDGANSNSIHDLDCTDVAVGVTLGTDNNSLIGMDYTFPKSVGKNEERVAVKIVGGCGNTVNEVQCYKFDEVEEDDDTSSVDSRESDYMDLENIKTFGLIVMERNGQVPKNNIFEDFAGGPVKLEGEKNTLKDVDALFISLSGKGHKLENCITDDYSCDDEDEACTMELVGCNFD
nr:uncharacterized protein LOC118438200 [Folsomia candida]